MNVIDSSGWIEFLTRGKNGPVFLPIVSDTDHLLVPTIVIYEVVKRILALTNLQTALDITGVMSHGQEVALDRTIALEAAQISLTLKLAMEYSIILATARVYEATLWTQDAHFKDIEGVQYVEK